MMDSIPCKWIAAVWRSPVASLHWPSAAAHTGEPMQAPDPSDIAVLPPRPDGETRFDFNLICESTGAPPAFPIDILPRLWGAWCEGAARGAGTSVDYVALGLLGSTASLVGGSRRVTPAPGWSEPCILWTALVGPP